MMGPDHFIECNDGFAFYLREHSPAWIDYERVEISYPSEASPLLKAFRDSGSEIYPSVPIPIISKIVRDHGGQKLPVKVDATTVVFVDIDDSITFAMMTE